MKTIEYKEPQKLSDLHNLSFDQCIKCTICTIYCPVAMATPSFPGPKQSGPDLERLRMKDPSMVDESLKYCSNCKRCEIACPSDVKIADIISEAKWKYMKRKFRVRDFFLAHTDLLGSAATLFGGLANFIINLKITRLFMDIILKIPIQKKFPSYEFGTLVSWFRKKGKKGQDQFKEQVVFYHGCFSNYNDHHIGKTIIAVLNKLGIGVNFTAEKCCGVPLIANGFKSKATKNAMFNIKHLSLAKEKISNTDKSQPIIVASPSCLLAMKFEYANLLKLDNSQIANDMIFITEFINNRLENNKSIKLKPVNLKAAYHSPCHLEKIGNVADTLDLLQKIPGLELINLHSECCGISGTYGFKKEYYEITNKIGSPLFSQINETSPDIVITDCETCKMQIEMNVEYKSYHPVLLLAMSMGLIDIPEKSNIESKDKKTGLN